MPLREREGIGFIRMEKTPQNAPPDVKQNNRGIIILATLVVLLIIFKLFVYPHFE